MGLPEIYIAAKRACPITSTRMGLFFPDKCIDYSLVTSCDLPLTPAPTCISLCPPVVLNRHSLSSVTSTRTMRAGPRANHNSALRQNYSEHSASPPVGISIEIILCNEFHPPCAGIFLSLSRKPKHRRKKPPERAS